MFYWLLKQYFIYRGQKLKVQYRSIAHSQSNLLFRIVKKAYRTLYFEKNSIKSIHDFFRLPTIDYDFIEDEILKIKNSKINELTAEPVLAFSKSSGTTSQSKIIPYTSTTIKSNFNAGKSILFLYLSSYPDSKIIEGKNFSLTGSYFFENGFVIGDVSSLFTYYLKPIYTYFRTPDLKTATIADWSEKLGKMIPIIAKQDVRWIAGVPSWMKLIVLELEKYEKKSIAEIWPNLEVFFYGGVDISPFESFYQHKFKGKLILWQTYNSSEGFFGIQHTNLSKDLMFLPNTNTYYEFIPKNEILESKPKILKIDQLKINEIYELVITNYSGLYRYRMGDLVQITNLNPLLYQVVGRTKSFINTFGEELMVTNTESAITILKQELNFDIQDYTVAPIILNEMGYHQWMIEFNTLPDNLSLFESRLDEILTELNSDYEAKRSNNLILLNLKVKIVPSLTFQNWLKKTQRENVQSKIPKLWKDLSIQYEIIRSLEV